MQSVSFLREISVVLTAPSRTVKLLELLGLWGTSFHQAVGRRKRDLYAAFSAFLSACHYPFNSISLWIVILSFRDSETEELFTTGRSRRFRLIEKVAKRKLDAVNAADKLDDLRVPNWQSA